MAISHFTLETCPNCGEEETAVGDPSYNRWHCFSCRADGSWEYTIDVATDPEGPPEVPTDPDIEVA